MTEAERTEAVEVLCRHEWVGWDKYDEAWKKTERHYAGNRIDALLAAGFVVKKETGNEK